MDPFTKVALRVEHILSVVERIRGMVSIWNLNLMLMTKIINFCCHYNMEATTVRVDHTALNAPLSASTRRISTFPRYRSLSSTAPTA